MGDVDRGNPERRWRLQALGVIAVLAPFNLVGRRSGLFQVECL